MTEKDGGAAFPGKLSVWRTPGGHQPIYEHHAGMSLRDYFAAKALSGYLQASALNGYAEPNEFQATQAARNAYMVADAMLKEREK